MVSKYGTYHHTALAYDLSQGCRPPWDGELALLMVLHAVLEIQATSGSGLLGIITNHWISTWRPVLLCWSRLLCCQRNSEHTDGQMLSLVPRDSCITLSAARSPLHYLEVTAAFFESEGRRRFIQV